jgi:hypothetical protein
MSKCLIIHDKKEEEEEFRPFFLVELNDEGKSDKKLTVK